MSTFSLKIVALIFMVIDHIGQFIPDTPIWFRYIGRLSAPLFMFTMVFGFSYTRNRKIYIIRMYLFSVGMAIMDYILNCFNNVGDEVTNNIFATLFSIVVIIRLIEFKRENNRKWKFYLSCFCIWQMISLIICYNIGVHFDNLGLVFVAFMGNVFYDEGGFIFVVLGILLYYVKDNKKNTATFYSLFCLIYAFIINTNLVPRIMTRLDYYGYDLLYNIFNFVFSILGFDVLGFRQNTFQWMMIGALPFMLLYNGNKGKSMKYFFYIFYPLHIFILFILSNMVL
ncbi:TraX family protein [Anaeromicropila herbilytica]|uniref:Conjugal transfer protein TraX n=1 Tax=Anaeromicropila herbilytica TaxID=2785025 RepID=A0A7R7EP29_9FIRM|nr:TraX family protein [Anaeromicropila herbilytica]BCN32176.1 conjugal transfer protein TraX [Anaeromicropila herbilytica]